MASFHIGCHPFRNILNKTRPLPLMVNIAPVPIPAGIPDDARIPVLSPFQEPSCRAGPCSCPLWPFVRPSWRPHYRPDYLIVLLTKGLEKLSWQNWFRQSQPVSACNQNVFATRNYAVTTAVTVDGRGCKKSWHPFQKDANALFNIDHTDWFFLGFFLFGHGDAQDAIFVRCSDFVCVGVGR